MTKKKDEVTDWIPCRTKPVRTGWYDCYYDNSKQNLPPLLIRRIWTGTKWVREDNVPCFFGSQSGDKWRGLVRKAV